MKKIVLPFILLASLLSGSISAPILSDELLNELKPETPASEQIQEEAATVKEVYPPRPDAVEHTLDGISQQIVKDRLDAEVSERKMGEGLGEEEEAIVIPEKKPVEKPEERYSLAPAEGDRWTTSSLNMRKGAGTSHGIVRSIPEKSRVVIHAESSNGWYQVTFNKDKGFVSGKYLTSTEPVIIVNTPASAPGKATVYKAMKLYLPDRTLSYQNGGQARGQAIIDADGGMVSTWGGAETFSSTDGLNTHFIGHNTNAFKGIWNYGVGQKFVVTDEHGTPATYQITRKLVVDDDGVGVEDGENHYNYIASTRGGEVITLQTCKTSDTNWIIRADIAHNP